MFIFDRPIAAVAGGLGTVLLVVCLERICDGAQASRTQGTSGQAPAASVLALAPDVPGSGGSVSGPPRSCSGDTC